MFGKSVHSEEQHIHALVLFTTCRPQLTRCINTTSFPFDIFCILLENILWNLVNTKLRVRTSSYHTHSRAVIFPSCHCGAVYCPPDILLWISFSCPNGKLLSGETENLAKMFNSMRILMHQLRINNSHTLELQFRRKTVCLIFKQSFSFLVRILICELLQTVQRNYGLKSAPSCIYHGSILRH